jgi:PAS domain S-box-containing protein
MPVTSTPHKISWKNIDLIYGWCNEHFARDLGITVHEIYGKTDRTFYSKIQAQKIRDSDLAVIRSGFTQDYEDEIEYENSKAWVHIIKTPTRDEMGKINGLITITSDITLKKNTDTGLQESERRLNIIEKYGRVSYWESLVNSLDISWSSGVFNLFPLNERSGSPTWETLSHFYIDKDAKRLSVAVELCKNTGESSELELQADLEDGSRVFHTFTIHKSKIPDNSPESEKLFGTVQDITKLKLAEHKLETLFEFSGDCVYIHSLKGDIIDVNSAVFKTLGYTKAEILQMSLKDIDVKNDTKSLEKILKSIQKNKALSYDTIHLSKDGKCFDVEVKSTLVELNDSAFIMSIAREITKRSTSIV